MTADPGTMGRVCHPQPLCRRSCHRRDGHREERLSATPRSAIEAPCASRVPIQQRFSRRLHLTAHDAGVHVFSVTLKTVGHALGDGYRLRELGHRQPDTPSWSTRDRRMAADRLRPCQPIWRG